MIKGSKIYRNSKRLNDDITLLDVAMECAYFLEQVGALGFKNWENGEIVDGPYTDRFFSKIKLMFPAKHCPDVTVLERLKKMDCRYSYERDTYRRSISYKENEDDTEYQIKAVDHDVWLITLIIPNRYLALDGNTTFEIDGIEVNYDDIDVIYDDDVSSDKEGGDDYGFGGFGGGDTGDNAGGDMDFGGDDLDL